MGGLQLGNGSLKSVVTGIK